MNEPLGLWIYCVIENKGELKLDCLGIHGTSPVFTVADGDFAMVVSQEPMKKYPLVRDYLIAHQLVNEKVMQTQPVLPVRFCTMAQDKEQILSEVLKNEERLEEFRKTLHQIEGKSEYGLRARWKNLDEVFAKLETESEKIKEAKEKVLKLPDHQRRASLIDVGHVVKEALEEKNGATADLLMSLLIPLACEHKKNDVLGDMNIMNAAFLVEAKKQAGFDERINAVVAQHESQIQFKYVGPIPPFNFVEIVIHFENGGEEGGKGGVSH